MYLEKLIAKDFRSFDEIAVSLKRDLTILVGENNGGKSNAIDAMRLLTVPLGGRREIYCETSDVRFGSGSTQRMRPWRGQFLACAMTLRSPLVLQGRACGPVSISPRPNPGLMND
jgi:predicted ATP-binding protein involved in virulence